MPPQPKHPLGDTVIFAFQLEAPLDFGIIFRQHLNYWSHFSRQLTHMCWVWVRGSTSSLLVWIAGGIRHCFFQIRGIVERSKHHPVLYARHYIVLPAERKFGLAQKNIQWWLKNFSVSEFEQVSIAKWGPKKQQNCEGQRIQPHRPFQHAHTYGLAVRFHSNTCFKNHSN